MEAELPDKYDLCPIRLKVGKTFTIYEFEHIREFYNMHKFVEIASIRIVSDEIEIEFGGYK